MAQPRFVNLSLRDGQQSTLDAHDWELNPQKMAKVLAASIKAGFSGAEVAGGQSFQIAIKCGVNPFTVASSLSHGLTRSCKSNDFELQMLFRGANALGFRHYDKDVVEATLNEFIKAGITKIRFFDALNDIDNLDLPVSVRDQPNICFEAALCFTHYADAPNRYTDEYYVSYAKALIAKGFNAIAIKDMSGQLTAERVSTLVPALQTLLKKNSIALTLHVHSTNAVASKGALERAIELGVDCVETTEGPLSAGSAHHSVESIAPELAEQMPAYAELQRVSREIWGPSPERRDESVPSELKDELSKAGVPGGAMPFVIRDLRQQESAIRVKYLAAHPEVNPSICSSFDHILALFIVELKRVCRDVNYPPLVTPTADICCKQAITNLAMSAKPHSDKISDRYLSATAHANPDPRFARLVLGYYGELKAYDTSGSVHEADESFTQFFESNNALQLPRSPQHPSKTQGGTDLKEAQQAAWQLIQKRGAEALSFANFDQLTLMYALKPTTVRNTDPVAAAVELYTERSEAAKIGGRGRTFPGYESLMNPVLEQLGAMISLDSKLIEKDLLELSISDLGETMVHRLFDIYIDLPIWLRVTSLSNHLSKLISSQHVSTGLKKAVEFVDASLHNLDLRPSEQSTESLQSSREKFSTINIGTLISSLALISSFINDVAKYATNPTHFAEKVITLEDLSPSVRNQKKPEADTDWARNLQRSIASKHQRIKVDIKRRQDLWR